MSATKVKPGCATLLTWLRDNLGRPALGSLTGTDHRALAAAVHIVELMSSVGVTRSLSGAFGEMVMAMQPSTRYLAYHAVAHVMDWPDRQRVWAAAGLPALGVIPRCEYE